MVNLTKKLIPVTLVLLAAVIACNAPRTNPLDPDNENNVYVSVEGTVLTDSHPRVPVEGAQIYWKEGGRQFITGADGIFRFEEIIREDGWLYINRVGFTPDSQYIEWGLDKNIETEIFLNSLPKLELFRILSRIEHSQYDTTKYELVVNAKINDDENDIDSVLIFNEELNLYTPLDYNFNTKYFEQYIDASSRGWDDLEILVGKNIDLHVKDSYGNIHNIGTESLKRVIRDDINYKSPAENNYVTPPFYLKWDTLATGHDFTFSTEIRSAEGLKPLVFSQDNIPSTVLQLQISKNFGSGSYYWQFAVTDNYGNIARSKPAQFKIE